MNEKTELTQQPQPDQESRLEQLIRFEAHRRALKINSPRYFGKRIWYPLAERTVQGSIEGKLIPGLIVRAALHSAKTRMVYEATSGEELPTNPVKIGVTAAFEEIPAFGDVGDLVLQAIKHRPHKDPDGSFRLDNISATVGVVSGLIPLVPSILPLKIQEAYENGILHAVAAREPNLVGSVILDSANISARRMHRREAK